jgi:hypothetical protein
MAYHALGRKADSDAALAALIAKFEQDAAYNIALRLCLPRRSDKAFEWLEKEIENVGAMTPDIVTENLLRQASTPTRAGCRSCARWAGTPRHSRRSSSR